MNSNPIEEEYQVDLLNEYDMELKMLEDWLDNPELEDGFQGISKVEETCQHREQMEEA